LIRNPTCHVWILKNTETKVKEIGELAKGKKTLVFCDSIELGTIVSKRYEIPHVYGATKKDRLATIQDADLVVVSRVGDEGISLPEVEQIIEISWLGRSRRQELQRFTRLLHSQIGKETGLPSKDAFVQEAVRLREPVFHILMTPEEYARDRKRLFSVMDKGFRVEIHREGVSERSIQRRLSEELPTRRLVPSRRPTPTAPSPAVTLPSTLTERLPGIEKTLSRLEPVEEKVTRTILANPTQVFTAKGLVLATGYSPNTIMNQAHLGKLVKMGFIRHDKDGYRSAITG